MDEMQANLERLSELERRLSVTLPVTDIASEVESRLRHLTRTVKMQGFRPGKVPLKVVARQYGSSGADWSRMHEAMYAAVAEAHAADHRIAVQDQRGSRAV